MNLKDLDFIQRRTVKVLTVGQVLGGFGLGSTLSIGSLLAAELSGSPAWAGRPPKIWAMSLRLRATPTPFHRWPNASWPPTGRGH